MSSNGVKIGPHLTHAQLYTSAGKTHTIYGTCLFALFWIQPLLGYAHHLLFVKKRSRTLVSHVHIWYGRALFIMAMVNGGLGLKLAANTTGGEIAYGVVAGVVGVAYIAGAVLGEFRRAKAAKAYESREQRPGSRSEVAQAS